MAVEYAMLLTTKEMEMRIGFLVLGMLFLAGCETGIIKCHVPDKGDEQDSNRVDCLGTTISRETDLINNVGDRVNFDVDSIVFNFESQQTLERQAAWMKQNLDVQLTIEGHADERGTREYNLALGDRRANAVKNYLVAFGIDASRISTISYGKERPTMLGDTEEAWAQNRRAVTTVD